MVQYSFKTSGKTRMEHDLLGDKEVPEEALFGVQTLRCIENFDISRALLCQYPQFIKAFGIVKMGAIMANHKLGLVSEDIKNYVNKYITLGGFCAENMVHSVVRDLKHKK